VAGLPAGARRARARPGVLAGAAALILLALGGGAVLAVSLAHHGRPAPAALAAGVRTPAATPPGAAVTFTATGRPGRRGRRSRPAAGPPAAAGGSPSAGPVPAGVTSTWARPPASPSSAPSHPGTPSPPASPGTLAAAPATVRLVPDSAGNSYQGSFTVTAQGGPVTFSISDPAPAGTLSVSPSAGTLRAGQTVTVTVTAPYPGGPPVFDTTLTVNPGVLTVGILYPPSG